MMTRSVDALRQQLVSLCALHGYQVVDTDLVEDAELFLTSASAALVPKLYTFERRGKPYVLRPEFTTIAMKRYLTMGRTQPTRWQFFDTVYQLDAAAQLLTQSYAFGVELIQSDGLEADLEVLELALRVSELLTTKPLSLVLNHVGFIQAVLNSFDLDPFLVRLLVSQPEQARALVDDRGYTITKETDAGATETMLNVLLESTQYSRTMGGRDRAEITDRLLRKYGRSKQADKIRQAFDVTNSWNDASLVIGQLSELSRYTHDNPEAAVHLTYLIKLCDALVTSGVPEHSISVRLNAAKNWQYYSGLTFSIDDGASHLINGGRYNNLSHMMGASVSVPAVGFTCHVDPFIEDDKDESPVQVAAEDYAAYREIARELRRHLISVVPASANQHSEVVRTNADGTFTLNDQLFPTMADLVSYIKGRS
ncbi:MAG: ATP phosphoribosyltransferase regulatory subunit [Anaerolinea sp.]